MAVLVKKKYIITNFIQNMGIKSASQSTNAAGDNDKVWPDLNRFSTTDAAHGHFLVSQNADDKFNNCILAVG
jgi:hypothetical protein